MKRIISMLLIAILTLMPVSVNASGAADTIIEKLASYTPQMRAQYISLLRPFLTSDAGVEAGIDNVKSGMFEAMLGTSFTPAQEDAFIRFFRSMSCIGESTGIRLKYADILQNKIPASVSSATAYGIDKMTTAFCQTSPAAKKIIEEDGYTAAVIANLMGIIPEVNGGALLEFKDGIFTVDNVNAEYSKAYDAVWAGYYDEEGRTVTAYKAAAKMADFLNTVPQSDRLFTANALADLGVCTVKGIGTVPPAALKTETENYVIIASMSGVAKSVFDGSVVIRTKDNIPELVEILVKSDNPMIYKLVGASVLNPVKNSVPTQNGIAAQLEPNAVYVIRTAAYPFIDANGWGKSYIAALHARGIINGKSDAEFMPEASITREEFIKLVVELFGLLDENATCEFTDVPAGAWYEKYVASAHAAGITDGIGDGKFGTGAPISRQDMAKIINTILVSKGIEMTGDGKKFKDDGKIADYAKSHVYAISGHIISGDDLGNFNPNKNATRQEAAKMVYGMLNLYVSSAK